jgi:hypothetical protein
MLTRRAMLATVSAPSRRGERVRNGCERWIESEERGLRLGDGGARDERLGDSEMRLGESEAAEDGECGECGTGLGESDAADSVRRSFVRGLRVRTGGRGRVRAKKTLSSFDSSSSESDESLRTAATKAGGEKASEGGEDAVSAGESEPTESAGGEPIVLVGLANAACSSRRNIEEGALGSAGRVRGSTPRSSPSPSPRPRPVRAVGCSLTV